MNTIKIIIRNDKSSKGNYFVVDIDFDEYKRHYYTFSKPFSWTEIKNKSILKRTFYLDRVAKYRRRHIQGTFRLMIHSNRKKEGVIICQLTFSNNLPIKSIYWVRNISQNIKFVKKKQIIEIKAKVISEAGI